MNPILYTGLPDTQKWHFRKANEIMNKRIQYNAELEHIMDVVCKYTNIDKSDVKSRNRMLRTKIARFYFCYLSRLLTDSTLQQIGDVVYRKHDTVIHAVKTVEDWMFSDKQVVSDLEEIETVINEQKIATV